MRSTFVYPASRHTKTLSTCSALCYLIAETNLSFNIKCDVDKMYTEVNIHVDDVYVSILCVVVLGILTS